MAYGETHFIGPYLGYPQVTNQRPTNQRRRDAVYRNAPLSLTILSEAHKK